MISRIALRACKPLLARILAQEMIHHRKMGLYWSALQQAGLLDAFHQDFAQACGAGERAIRKLAFFRLELPEDLLPDYERTDSTAREVLHRQQRKSYRHNHDIVAEREANVADPREEDPQDRLRAAEAQRKLYEIEAVLSYLDLTDPAGE